MGLFSQIFIAQSIYALWCVYVYSPLSRAIYGTIIVNEKTHEPVKLLDGRNGDTLREWLKINKNIKVVTRDRASAYAKVISEELPDAMQVADRLESSGSNKKGFKL